MSEIVFYFYRKNKLFSEIVSNSSYVSYVKFIGGKRWLSIWTNYWYDFTCYALHANGYLLLLRKMDVISGRWQWKRFWQSLRSKERIELGTTHFEIRKEELTHWYYLFFSVFKFLWRRLTEWNDISLIYCYQEFCSCIECNV